MGCGTSFCRNKVADEPGTSKSLLVKNDPIVGVKELKGRGVDSKDISKQKDSANEMSKILSAAVNVSEPTEPLLENQADIEDINSLIAEVKRRIGPDKLGSSMSALMTSLLQLEDILKTVSHILIPPPGGQIVAAVISVGTMLIKGAANVTQCCEMALWMNKLLYLVLKNKAALQSGSEGTRSALFDFLEACRLIKEFVRGVLDQTWFFRMWKWRDTAQELEKMKDMMNKVTTELQLSAQLGAYTKLTKVDEEGKKIVAMIEEAGGIDAVGNSPERLKEVALATGGCQGLELSVLQNILELIKSGLRQTGSESHESAGPHNVIANVALRQLWRDKFQGEEKVPWDTFFAVFPYGCKQYLEEGDIKALSDLLWSIDNRNKFKLACDIDDLDTISVTELSTLFSSDDVHLVQKVEQLLKTPKKKGMEKRLPPFPERLHGRDSELAELRTVLTNGSLGSEQRVVLISGEPGVGKKSIASKVLDSLYEEGLAVGGVWHCQLFGAKTRVEVIQRIVEGLSRVFKMPDATEGIEATLALRLAELKASESKTYALISGVEEILGSTMAPAGQLTSLSNHFQALLVQLVRVKNLRVVVTSRQASFGFTDLEKALGGKPPYLISLKPLSLDDGIQLIQQHRLCTSRGDAAIIAKQYDCNPQILEIISIAMRDNRMTVEEAKLGPNLASLAGGDTVIERNINHMALCLERTFQGMKSNQVVVLLKLSVLLPGSFTKEVLVGVLGLQHTSSADLLKRLTSFKLLQHSNEGPHATETYRVARVVREVAIKILEDPEFNSSLKISEHIMVETWKQYIAYCRSLMSTDFKDYRVMPMSTFPMIMQNKAHIQQILRLVTKRPDIAQQCLQEYEQVINTLPYLPVGVYDSPLVVEACQGLIKLALLKSQQGGERALLDSSLEASPAWFVGLCKTVQAFFAPAKAQHEQEDVLRLIKESMSDLSSCLSDGRIALVRAMASRREGIILRDMGRYEESEKALRDAKYEVERCSLSSDDSDDHSRRTELILDLAELAGTLDYLQRVHEGEQVAEEAVLLAREFYGSVAHPTTALCLTTQGYFFKLKGDYQRAKEIHLEAFQMRASVLGESHLESAFSLQQAAISMIELGEYQAAEDALSKSLAMRTTALAGEIHPYIYATHAMFADLFLKMGAGECREKAESHLRKCLSLGESLNWPRLKNEKLRRHAQLLVDLLKARQGVEDIEGVIVLETQYGLNKK